MPVRKEGLPTPPDPGGFTSTVTFCGEIPDLLEYRAALATMVFALTKWVTWNKDGTMRAKQSADYMKAIITPAFKIGEECVMCGCCPGDAVYVDVQIQNAVDTLPENYDPNEPGTINELYDSTDPAVIQAIQAALCEACKVWVAMYAEAIYSAKVEVCADQSAEPAWKRIAERASEAILGFGASVLDAGIGVTSKILAIAGIEAGGLQIFPDFLRGVATQFEQPSCPARRIDSEVLDAFACCMFNRLLGGFNWDAFRTVFDSECEAVIELLQDKYPLAPVAALQLFETEIRGMFAQWQKQPSNYMSMATLIPSIANNPFITPQLCDDCTDCQDPDAILENIEIFNDPRATVTPLGPIVNVNCGTAYNLSTEVMYMVSLDKPYCVDSFVTELCRPIGETKPTRLDIEIGGVNNAGIPGPSGPSTLFITFPERYYVSYFYFIVKEEFSPDYNLYNLKTNTYIKVVQDA